MKPIQAGKNGWTCMVGPDGTPMCADQGAMEWVKAWMDKGPAPQKIGFVYMLKRNILDHPAIERGVVNLDTVLFHHFLELAVADRIRHIPTDGPQDDVPFEVTAL
jgi:hypothetical protein